MAMRKAIMVRQTKWISKRSAEETKRRWKKLNPNRMFQVKQDGSKFAVFSKEKVKPITKSRRKK